MNILKNVPAFIKFASVEPLLEAVDLISDGHLSWLNWVIIGGESGYKRGKYRYRPCQLEWIRYLIKQCRAASVPVFVKQLGSHLAQQMKLEDWAGGNILEWPDDIRVTEFPKDK